MSIGFVEIHRQRDLMVDVVQRSRPVILERHPWVCMACDRQACGMLNTPFLDTTGLVPIMEDMLPLFVCAAPACEAEARRYTEKKMKDMSRECEFPGFPSFREVYHSYTCKHCGRIERRADGKLLECGSCRAAWNCNKACQKQDWKRHKRICIEATSR